MPETEDPGIWIAPDILNGGVKTRFEYASGQIHDVTRWNEPGTAPDEKGTLLDWVFAALGRVTVTLQWSEEKRPNRECSYNHCDAQTPFGVFRVEWKGWKEHPSYSLYFNGDWIGSSSVLDDCKETALKWFTDKINEVLA